MRLVGAVGPLLIAITLPAAAQWTNLRLPENVYSAIPFTVDIQIDCPPPDETPPPPGCNGTMGVWFEVRDKADKADKSVVMPRGFVTIYPFLAVKAGPFTFHKQG